MYRYVDIPRRTAERALYVARRRTTILIRCILTSQAITVIGTSSIQHSFSLSLLCASLIVVIVAIIVIVIMIALSLFLPSVHMNVRNSKLQISELIIDKVN